MAQNRETKDEVLEDLILVKEENRQLKADKIKRIK